MILRDQLCRIPNDDSWEKLATEAVAGFVWLAEEDSRCEGEVDTLLDRLKSLKGVAESSVGENPDEFPVRGAPKISKSPL